MQCNDMQMLLLLLLLRVLLPAAAVQTYWDASDL
jgi:hypothetical protein